MHAHLLNDQQVLGGEQSLEPAYVLCKYVQQPYVKVVIMQSHILRLLGIKVSTSKYVNEVEYRAGTKRQKGSGQDQDGLCTYKA